MIDLAAQLRRLADRVDDLDPAHVVGELEALKCAVMLAATARPNGDHGDAPAALLTATQAAKRLGVSADYVRAHGDALRIAVPLDGVVRYDPVAIAALCAARRPPEK